MQKSLRNMEVGGVFFVLAFSVFLRYYYTWAGGALGVLISSVNNSIWENTKVFIISYMFWAVIEVLFLKPPFKQFVVSKVIAVYSMGAASLAASCAAGYLLGSCELWVSMALGIVFVCFAQFLSYYLTNAHYTLKAWFVQAVFLLVLLIVMLCCFSVFPPEIQLFQDADTGLYGIIPDNIDVGAFYLDSLYKNML